MHWGMNVIFRHIEAKQNVRQIKEIVSELQPFVPPSTLKATWSIDPPNKEGERLQYQLEDMQDKFNEWLQEGCVVKYFHSFQELMLTTRGI